MVLLRDLNEGMGDGGSVSLVCPICRGELALEKAYRRLGRVRTGELRCLKGCAVFQIIYGVPVMLSPGQPANFAGLYPSWQKFVQQYGKQKLMEAIASGEFGKEREISGPSVTEECLRKAKWWMSKAGWRQYLKTCNTSSEDPDALAIGERLRRVEGGVVVDIGCGGGFTTERVLQEIQTAAYSVSLDIDFVCVKLAGKRAEFLGMSDRSMEICADLRHLPFDDKSLAAAYTRSGFGHIRRYVDVIKEVHRTLENGGILVTTDYKLGMVEFPKRVGLDYEEQREILRRLDIIAHGDEFVEDLRKVGFDVSIIDDVLESMPHYFLLDATKN